MAATSDQGQGLAQYSCDLCKNKKVSCSRSLPHCDRCVKTSEKCVYTRNGPIHRKRRRLDKGSSSGTPMLVSSAATLSTLGVGSLPGALTSSGVGSDDSRAGTIQSQLAPEIDATRSILEAVGSTNGEDHSSMGALSVLSDACAAVWHDATDLDRASHGFFLFEEQTPQWIDAFVTTLKRGEPLALTAAPEDALESLRACRPQSVKPRAWLVMYYSIILSLISSTTPADKETKMRLTCNLWLALNDVRVLLEPSEVNIQALILLASHVEEFTTPSLCWLLVSNACRMLQALGVNVRNASPERQRRRKMMFWHLNIVDKGLSMIFGRPPTLHGGMARSVGLPSVAELLPSTPAHSSASGASGAPGALFGAHFFHQVMQLSVIMGEIWTTVYDSAVPDEHNIATARDKLVTWHEKAGTILRAAAMAEGPLLDAKGVASLELGVLTTDFYHHHLLILLARQSETMKADSISSSMAMLKILPALVSDSEEVYNGIIWMMVCSPFTAFLTLFGAILSEFSSVLVDYGAALEAMEILPVFLKRMGVRNSLASKLEKSATVLLDHTKQVLLSRTQPIEGPVDLPSTFSGYDFSDLGLDILNLPSDDGIFDIDWLNFGETSTDWIATASASPSV